MSARPFSAFGQSLYDELDRTSAGDTVDVEIGLFGDLNVMAGEHVVMGRYRYRVDSTAGVQTGHLAFHARLADDPAAVPIVLVFEESDGTWALREASLVPTGASAVENLLSPLLEPWVREAAKKVSS